MLLWSTERTSYQANLLLTAPTLTELGIGMIAAVSIGDSAVPESLTLKSDDQSAGFIICKKQGTSA
jgi:hypothetical protein